MQPNDPEFYLLGRIEGKLGREFRATVAEQDPLNLMKHFQGEAAVGGRPAWTFGLARVPAGGVKPSRALTSERSSVTPTRESRLRSTLAFDSESILKRPAWTSWRMDRPVV